MPFLYIQYRVSNKTRNEKSKTMCDSVNHTPFPKEDHVPDYVGTNMVIRVIVYRSIWIIRG